MNRALPWLRSDEQRGGGRVDRSVQHGDEQRGGGVGVEAGHLDALGQTVLPQGDDGVGSRVAGPHGGEHDGRAGHGDLVHERRGRVVEQVGVVDEQQQAAVLRPGRQRGDGAVQQIGAVAGDAPAGSRHVQQGGDGAERQLGRRPSGGDLGGVDAVLRGGAHAGAPEGGLADPRGPGEDDPVGLGAGHAAPAALRAPPRARPAASHAPDQCGGLRGARPPSGRQFMAPGASILRHPEGLSAPARHMTEM